MKRTYQCFGSPTDFAALHELHLRAVEVLRVLAVDCVLANVELAREHHLARGKELRRPLVDHPGCDENPDRCGQDRNPPAPQEQRTITVEARQK